MTTTDAPEAKNGTTATVVEPLRLTEHELAELTEVEQAMQQAFERYVAPLQAAVAAVLRLAERRLGLPRDSIGRTHRLNGATVEPAEAPGA